MKKLLAVLGILTLAGSTAATLVACGKSLPVNTDIWLITDAGKVADKSFNQSGFNGGNYFLQEVLGKQENISYTEPPSISVLDSAYTNAKADGAKTLVLPGFHHAVEGGNRAPDIMKEGSTIILDSDNGKKENQIGIMYRGDISGFLAAFGGMIQLSHNSAFKDQTLKMATFGGSHNAGAVDNFMVGYLAAIPVYKFLKEDKNLELAKSIGMGDQNVSFERISKQVEAPTGEGDQMWFTNSFTIGDASKITNDMLADGANIIMPVAGPQTSDVLGKMKAADPKAEKLFLVGVDTDQSQQYADNDGAVKNRFLSSAQKALVESTVISLGHSKEYVKDVAIQDKVAQYAKETKSSFTIENDGQFDKYDLDANKADAWEGKTLWMSGKAASGGKNQLEGTTSDKINSKITTPILENASKDLFAKINVDPSVKNILSNETVNDYADTIIKEISNEQSKTPNLDSLREYVGSLDEVDVSGKTDDTAKAFTEALEKANIALDALIELEDNELENNLRTAFEGLLDKQQ